MTKVSAGILLYRRRPDGVQVLLVHPGGPYWKNKDIHSWSVPKGEIDDGEDPAATARREFCEETGVALESELLVPLPAIRSSSNKYLHTFVTEGDFDPSALSSNTFEMEWPPKSGQKQLFPEVDAAAWYNLDEARQKLHKGQVQLVDLLEELI